MVGGCFIDNPPVLSSPVLARSLQPPLEGGQPTLAYLGSAYYLGMYVLPSRMLLCIQCSGDERDVTAHSPAQPLVWPARLCSALLLGLVQTTRSRDSQLVHAPCLGLLNST